MSDTATPRRARDLDANALILAIQAQRRLPQTTDGYWDTYCALLRQLCRATTALVAQGSDVLLGTGAADDGWLAEQWTARAPELTELRDRAQERGFAFAPVQDATRRTRIVAVARANGLADTVLLLDIPERERAQLNEIVVRALLAADFPANVAADGDNATRSTAPAGVATGSSAAAAPVDTQLLDLLDVAAQVLHEERFGTAALTLVNGLAARLQAAPVALGWLQGDAMRVINLSGVDRFERNTRRVQQLEDAFLEAIGKPDGLWSSATDNDPELVAQAPLRATLGVAAHCALAVQDATGVTRAVVLLGFATEPAQRPDLRSLHAMLGFVLPWLLTLRDRERWWGARAAAALRRGLATVIGPTHVWRKATIAATSALLLYALFGTWDYRIEAQSQLTTDATRLISAQFDGRVDEVNVTLGDAVKQGTVLLSLDTRDLRQQEMDTRADLQRFAAEADKARAAGNLAELEIARARMAQSQARLARVLNYLSQARFVAPFDGVIVDGERKNLINAPVKKGDTLFRVARVDGLYIELLVPEREVRYIDPAGRGELRLLSRPDEPIAFKLATFIPVAQVKGQEGNHFLIKAELQNAPEAWWRPGMSGVAKLDGGRRNIAWILTHRLIDTLRLRLWWWWS